MGYLHLDIKPDNILIGDGQGDIYLIDYGISEKYQDDDYNHKVAKKRKNIFGNLSFMSKNAFNFKNQSRRDDLIGFVYNLILFVNGNLPWQ